jgi:hypothetical protein
MVSTMRLFGRVDGVINRDDWGPFLLSPFTIPWTTGTLEGIPGLVTAKTIYFCVHFPSGYRYYFVFQKDNDVPILIDHPFRLFYPQTITVSWDTIGGGEGVNLDIASIPWFPPFGDATVRVHIPQEMYDAVIAALSDPISSMAALRGMAPTPQDGPVTVKNEVNFVASEMLDLFQLLIDVSPKVFGGLEPPIMEETSGTVEFILISTEEGPQFKLDLTHPFPVPLEDPITVETLTWQEVLFQVVMVPEYDFYYIFDADLAMTFIDPKFCFLRQWVPWPSGWAYAIKQFAGV